MLVCRSRRTRNKRGAEFGAIFIASGGSESWRVQAPGTGKNARILRWLRGGVDLNHRPLGYETREKWLSDTFCGTGGTVRQFQKALVNANGGVKGVRYLASKIPPFLFSILAGNWHCERIA